MRAKAIEVIAKAERALGAISPRQLVDLLLDNMPELLGVAEAKTLLVEIGR